MNFEGLTPREEQITRYILRGLENKEIALTLGISYRTVEDHRLAVLRKFKCRNAVELFRAVHGITEV